MTQVPAAANLAGAPGQVKERALQRGRGMAQNSGEDLVPLRSVPDLRGTATRDASGVMVGPLWGTLAEADTGLLRYLDLQLEGRSRHVLVPIGHARLREQDGSTTVRLRAALLEDLESIPEYDPDAAELDEAFERSLLEYHGRLYHGEYYYAHPAFDHSGLYAGAHPIVRGPPPEPRPALLPLSELPGYQVARDEVDIRGWELAGFAAAPLGRITDLIVDPAAEKVRYVVLAEGDRQVLLPVGFLAVHKQAGRVTATSLFPADLTALPGYAGGGVDRAVEDSVRAALREQLRGHRRYQLPDFNPQALTA